MQFTEMFVTAVCVLFFLKLKWPKSKNFDGPPLFTFKTDRLDLRGLDRG